MHSLANIDLAKKTGRPMCQDTGIQTFFVEVGIDFPEISKLKRIITNGLKKAKKDIRVLYEYKIL